MILSIDIVQNAPYNSNGLSFHQYESINKSKVMKSHSKYLLFHQRALYGWVIRLFYKLYFF